MPEERLPAVVAEKEWHHWGLFRALLDAAEWYRPRDPQEGADIAALALAVVDLLEPLAIGGEPVAQDMRAKAYCLLSECRLAFDLDGARQAITAARQANEAGAGEALDKAEIFRVDAAYAAAAGEFETAETILGKALALHRAAGDAHLEGRTLILMAETVGYASPEKGLAHIERGLQLVNPVREPRMELRAQHHMAEFLVAAGRPEEALAIMDRARPLYREFREETVELSLHWLQGRIARGLKKATEAVLILRLVREEFRARDLRQEFLLVSLDLAEAHVGQGELATCLRLLTETTPALASWNLHNQALTIWLLFQGLLESGRLGAAALATLFDRVRLYYRRHWRVPAAEPAIQ